MLEATDRLLPREDKEISRRLEAVFKGSGLNIIKNAKIKTLKTGNGVEVLLDDSTFIRADIALISIGRLPSISTLNLEKAGVALKDGKISVDGYLATNIPHIYAVGDVLGRHYLAHVASYEGIKAAENIFYKKTSVDYSAVPNCIFTKPEIGSVGISEEKAPQNGLDCITVKLPFAAVSKARINGETDGFIKVVIDKHTKRVLGAHILGAYASELIAAFGIAIRTGLKIDELGEVIYAHPSLSESILDLVSRVKEQIFY
jgi:dihydrolipoamide dehydrogenase